MDLNSNVHKSYRTNIQPSTTVDYIDKSAIEIALVISITSKLIVESGINRTQAAPSIHNNA